MTPAAVLFQLADCGVVVHLDDGRLRLDAPRGSLTPDLLAVVKSCKAGQLEILQSNSLSPGGSGAGSDDSGVAEATPARTASVESIAQSTRLGDAPKVDAEFDRFFACAVPTPNGLGLYDPSESPDMPSGVPIEDWRAFERDCGRLGRGVRP